MKTGLLLKALRSLGEKIWPKLELFIYLLVSFFGFFLLGYYLIHILN